MTTRSSALLLAGVLSMPVAACSKASDDTGSDQKKASEAAGKTTTAATDATTSPVTGEALLKRVDQCWTFYETWDKDALRDCYVDKPEVTYIDSVPPQMPIASKADALTAAGVFRNAFPDFKGDRSIILANGNKTLVVVRITGTHKNATLGMPPTGKPLSMLTAEVAEFDAQGRIQRIHYYADHATMFHQLGIVESASAPASEPSPGESARVAARNDDRERANLEVIKNVLADIAKGDAKGAVAMYAPDAVFRYLPQGEPNVGAAAIEQSLHRYVEVATDLEMTTRDAWAAGDWVVAELTMKGKMAADMPGAKGSKGKPWQLNSLELFQLADGKVKRHWTFANALKFAVDVGLFDPAILMGG